MRNISEKKIKKFQSISIVHTTVQKSFDFDEAQKFGKPEIST